MTNPKILCNCSLTGEPNYGPVLCEICDQYDDVLTEQLREKKFNERMAWDHPVDALEEPLVELSETPTPEINVISIEELEDGGALMTLKLDLTTLHTFAGQYVLSILTNKVNQILFDVEEAKHELWKKREDQSLD